MTIRPSVNVIAPDFAYGLGHSGKLAAEVLANASFKVRLLHADYLDKQDKTEFYIKVKSHVMRGWRQVCGLPPFRNFLRRDVNIFLERLHPNLFKMARRQILIPNQEWFFEKDRPHLREIDLVVCKTLHAEEIFSKLGCRTAFSSFTSTDRRMLNSRPKRREFFLMSGKREGIVEPILRLWARHPEWPMLTVSSRRIPDNLALPNVRPIRDYVPAEEIAQLQNEYLFHLGITAAEGFGHKLNEAMSCGALVITTDGPPMNELVRPERGFLVKWNRTSPKSLGAEFHFDENDLEQTIEDCLRLSPQEADRMAHNARDWFEKNDRFFRRTLPEIVHNLFTASVNI
jgi:hypothetical protein